MATLSPRQMLVRMRNPAVGSGKFCHVYNRGVEKRPTFLDGDDYARFLTYLKLMNGTRRLNIANLLKNPKFDPKKVPQEDLGDPLVCVVAFCLMPNHFHLVLKSATPGGVSKYMQRVETGYTMYFNAKNERSGHLFQGRFKDKVAEDDRYLRTLVYYVHRNPVAESKLSPEEQVAAAISYPYSSSREYASGERFITTENGCPNYFPTLETLRLSLLPHLSRLNLDK